MIVCGDDGMTFRLVEELVYRRGENVTVVLPSRRRNHGPQISRVPTVRVVENDRLDEDAFSAARIGTAKALALMVQDDVGNIHAALRALEITDVRIVVRVYNTNLGNRIEGLLGDCVLLSDASMASPTFVAAALGEVEPRYLPIADRTLYVTTAELARRIPGPSWTITTTESRGVLLPGPEREPGLAITAAVRRPRALRTTRHRVRRLVTRFWDELREILDRKLRFVTVSLVLVILLGTLLIWQFHNDRPGVPDISWITAGYVALLAAAGGIDPDLAAPAAEKLAHTIVAFAGVLLVPVFTASIVENMVGRRIATQEGRLRGPVSDHVIVIGLGNVGIQVATQLHNLGVPVVAVERDGRSRGVEAARSQGIPVVLGDASHSETLHNAQVRTCRSLVAVTSNDIVNLEAALHARRLRPELRTVLRLFEPDLANRVHDTFGIGATLSVAGVAAAEFAAAMTDRNVKGTIPLGRMLLLVGEITVGAGSIFDGAAISEIDVDEQVRVLAVCRPGRTEWRPDPARRLRSGETLLVLATRPGLAGMVADAAAPVAQE
ncbi:NAD-binding protein [Stackebrandtia albiflava]